MVLCVYIYSSPYIWTLVLHALHYIMNVSITVQSRVLKAAEVQNSRRWEGITGNHQCVLTLFVQSFAKRLLLAALKNKIWVDIGSDQALIFLHSHVNIILLLSIPQRFRLIVINSYYAVPGLSKVSLDMEWVLHTGCFTFQFLKNRPLLM